MANRPQLDAFGVIVTDMARALSFYRQAGLEIPKEADDQPHVEVDLGGGIRVMFDTVETIRSFDPDWEPPQGGHRVALAFRCADAAMVDAVHARLVASGGRSHKEPWDAFWGQRYAMVVDPDGNGVDLYAALPAAD
jgi:uncharacterized glyoxalase superfamily protein PhnB